MSAKNTSHQNTSAKNSSHQDPDYLTLPPFELDRVCPSAIEGVRVMPVIHSRVDSAAVVRAVLDRLQPDAIAVELPASLKAEIIKAVARLPEITVLLAEGEDDGAEPPLVWVAVPGDPFVEALRWALKHRGAHTIYCIDPDLPYPEKHQDAVPDPYAIWSIGPEVYLDNLLAHHSTQSTTQADQLREHGMAWHLQKFKQDKPNQNILALMGAAHVKPVSEFLNNAVAQPLARIHRKHTHLFHLSRACLPLVMIDSPLAHAVFMQLADTRAEGQAKTETKAKTETETETETEKSLPPCPGLADTYASKISFRRGALRVIARKTQDAQAQRTHNIVLYAAWRAQARLFAQTPHAAETTHGALSINRQALNTVVWQIATGSYHEQTRETIEPWQRRLYFDYANRLSQTAGQLVPDLYHWVIAARGIANDNFAWEVFEVGRTYPWQAETSDLPTIRIDGDELDLGTRRVRFRRRFFKVKRTAQVRMPLKNRPATDDPEKWLDAFDEHFICSHEPESIVLEDYGNFIKHKGMAKLSEAQSRTEPFASSFLDGIDIRETLRNIGDDKIYVKHFQKVPGGAGSVVLIFDDDSAAPNRDAHDNNIPTYPYLMTWHGEHNNESDIAFYATNPADQVVGPGIMRATYGGLLMVYPPRRLPNVWEDMDYFKAQTKAEVLLMAGVDYSLEKLIMVVSAKKISPIMQHYAAAQGKQIVHIPLGTLSPSSIEKIRVVHLLSGANTRHWAKDYIW